MYSELLDTWERVECERRSLARSRGASGPSWLTNVFVLQLLMEPPKVILGRDLLVIGGLAEVGVKGSMHVASNVQMHGGAPLMPKAGTTLALKYLAASSESSKVAPCLPCWLAREREYTQGDRILFSSVGLWQGFLGVQITRSPYLGCRM